MTGTELLHLVYALAGALAVALALVSRLIRRTPTSEPLLALVVGVAVGPSVLGLVVLDEHVRDLVLLEGGRFLLAASVMAAALRFPARHLGPMLRSVALLLLLVMPLAAVVAGAGALLLGLPLALAAVVGACLCPTDPVLAANVVTGEPAERDLPARVRQMLTLESGANDGLALPLVGLAVAAALPASTPGDVVGRVLWEVAGGAAIGVALGVAAAAGVTKATQHRDLEEGPELVLTLLLTVATLGVAKVAGTGGVLAVFVAGIAYNRAIGDDLRVAQEGVDEAVNRYAVLPLFVVLGATLPWADWAALGPAGLVLVAVVLLVRRPPFVLAAGRALGLRLREAAVVAWFGPVGLSAVFYLAHVRHEGVTDPRVFAAGTLAVAASVVAFGVTATPGRVLYARGR